MLRRILLATFCLTILAMPAMAKSPQTVNSIKAHATAPQTEKIIHVGVNGMVCDFCAQTLKKTFGKQPGVKQVDISLEDKLVTLHTAPNSSLSDAEITKLISHAGYAVTTIHRM